MTVVPELVILGVIAAALGVLWLTGPLAKDAQTNSITGAKVARPMRSLLVVSLLCLALLAGCSDSDGSDDPVPTPPTPAETFAPIATPVVHGRDGKLLPLSAYPGELPVFAEKYMGDYGAGEPTVAISRDGTAIYPTIEFDLPPGVGALATSAVLRTRDNGSTWKEVTPMIAGQVSAQPTSLDPYVYADPVTGRLFNIDLNLANGGFLSWSDDGAESWMHNPACCGIPVDDHQTLFSGPATTLEANPALYPGRIVYFCINQVASATCTKSLDGGATWVLPTTVFQGVEVGDGGPGLDSVCGGLHGHGHASEATGTVFLPKGHCGVAMVGRSTDNGLTWQTIIVDNTVGFDGHEAIVSTDRAGNVYYFFLDELALPRLSVSTDDGQTWSEPMNVTAPGVTRAKFPSVVAGEDGHVAFLYLGTTSPAGQGLYDEGNETYADNATWNGYVGFSLNALDAEPVFATVTAHPDADPLHRGGCAGRCQVEGGGMYDFLDIEVHPLTGQVWVALVDNCNDHGPGDGVASCSHPDGSIDSVRRALGVVGVQLGGTLLGTRLP
jgi:hypothetical protein